MKSLFLLSVVAFSSSVVAQDSFDFAPEISAKPESNCLTACCETLTSRTAQTYNYYQDTGHFIGGTGSWAVNTHGYSG